MRVWLKPDRMRAYGISTDQVMEALAEQSVIGSPGRLGRASGQTSQSLEYVLTYSGRYNTPEQYGDIILRGTEEGEILRLKDVARVELGSEFYDIYSDLDGKPSAAIVLKQGYGSNAQEVIERIKVTLEEIKASSFPPGMDYEISYDVSSFLDASMEKVLHTLFEAFLLVALRGLPVPRRLALDADPDAGGAGLAGWQFLLHAAVRGEHQPDHAVRPGARHRHRRGQRDRRGGGGARQDARHGHGALPATQAVMHEISGAIIAITLVMTAVFVPVTFMSGPVGIFYRQFSITMAVAIVLSGVVALTLTPVLCAMLLKPLGRRVTKRGPFGRALGAFDRWFERFDARYTRVLTSDRARRACDASGSCWRAVPASC
jgi:HAE1 family hydrophobic/amphiphilic exporter-1